MDGRQRITISNAGARKIGVAQSEIQKIGMGNAYKITIGADPYEGEYVVTPTRERQVLETKHLAMTENVVIEPIPQNYGLITYNGFELTIS